ncbi:MAG: hypothetical protein P8Y70_17000 [Candidatus Lokiarchaeota archaeon]
MSYKNNDNTDPDKEFDDHIDYEKLEKEQEMQEEIDDLEEDILDELEDLEDDINDELEDIFEGIGEEQESHKDVAEKYDEKFRNKFEKNKDKLRAKQEKIQQNYEKLKEKMERKGEKDGIDLKSIGERLKSVNNKIKERIEKINEHLEESKEKAKAAREKFERMNISVPGEMKDDWKDWADNLKTSVSELIRTSMGAVGKALSEGNLKDIENIGEQIEKAVKASGIEELGEKIEASVEVKPQKVKPQEAKIYKETEVPTEGIDKDRLKKRVQGLIKLQGNIPISKLAQIMNIADEQAENLIYEIAAEGIDGSLEEGIFKFKNDPDEVIRILFTQIDKM